MSVRDESVNAVLPALLDAPLSAEPTAGSLQRQLHQRFRQAILAGRLAAGVRLPGSRALAEQLSISRNTVIAVYEHLCAEGYVRADRQGTRVASLSRQAALVEPVRPLALPTAHRLEAFAGMPAPALASQALRPGTPALAQFPLGAWRRGLDRVIQRHGPSALGYGESLGEPALRAAIAAHVSMTRGVCCTPAQVVMTDGAQEALSLCVRLLTNPGDIAWIEEPGYRGARAALLAGDLRVEPVPIDRDGLSLRREAPPLPVPRLIYTTPSHQYPLGAVLSVARRLELMAYAKRHGAWIVEDDYDSEFRHGGEPIGAMQGLVAAAPVVYVGTFSKTLFPALRLGFMILPQALLPMAAAPLRQWLRGGHRHEQLALADFIERGEFGRHLGRMRRLYRERQQALREAIKAEFTVPYDLCGGEAGLHLTLRLPACYPDQKIVALAREIGMAPAALSAFYGLPGASDNGLVLGYGNTSSDRMAPLVRRLVECVRASAEAAPADLRGNN